MSKIGPRLKAKSDFINSKLEQNSKNGKTFWESLKEVIPCKKSKGRNDISIIEAGTHQYVEPCQTAQRLNKFLSGIALIWPNPITSNGVILEKRVRIRWRMSQQTWKRSLIW